MVSTTVLLSDHDRNGSSTQAVGAQFFVASIRRGGELPARRDLTQIVRSNPTGASMNFASDNGAGVAPEILEAIVASIARQRARLRRGRLHCAGASALERGFRDQGRRLPGGDGHRRQRSRACGAGQALGTRSSATRRRMSTTTSAARRSSSPAEPSSSGSPGRRARSRPRALRETLERFPRGLVKSAQPGALSLSQATRSGDGL